MPEGARIGLVGCGRWGKHILRDLSALGCEVAVVARSEASRATAEAGGAATVVGSIGELPQVDGIVVATPISTHATVVEEALELNEDAALVAVRLKRHQRRPEREARPRLHGDI